MGENCKWHKVFLINTMEFSLFDYIHWTLVYLFTRNFSSYFFIFLSKILDVENQAVNDGEFLLTKSSPLSPRKPRHRPGRGDGSASRSRNARL